jgi:predicted ArsR family transcriptional regulator
MVSRIKESYHPKAYLEHVKSVKNGLVARTKILEVLERNSVAASAIAHDAAISYETVRYHLRLLEADGTVRRVGKKRPCLWHLTGLGQKRLVS